MDKSKNPPSRNKVGAASNSIADKQLREAILNLKKPDKFLSLQPIEAELQDLIDLFHTYGNRERVDELEHIDNKPNVRLWFDGFYGVDDRIKELNREVES